MYENVQKTERGLEKYDQRDWGLSIPVIIVVVLLSAIIISIIWLAGTYPRYWKYVGKLSDSTYYSYQNESLKVYVDEEQIPVNKDNAYYVFEYLSSNGIGKRRKEIPDKVCDIRIEYGDGASLSCWRINAAEEPEYAEDERMFVSYQNGDYSYMYTIGSKDVDTVERHLKR